MTARKVMYVAAVQIGLTVLSFILFKRPYLWALHALQYYAEITCGSHLDQINAKFNSYDSEHQLSALGKVEQYRKNCDLDYRKNFNQIFEEYCIGELRQAFVTIPLVSTILVLCIVFLLQYEPFNSKTLKKPTWVFAFLFSVILIAVNVGEIIAIIIPVLNKNAGPKHSKAQERADKCGLSSLILAISIILISTTLSGLICSYIIRLYAYRAKYQDDHVKNLQMHEELKKLKENEKDREKREKQEKKRDDWENQDQGRDRHSNDNNNWGNNDSGGWST